MKVWPSTARDIQQRSMRHSQWNRNKTCSSSSRAEQLTPCCGVLIVVVVAVVSHIQLIGCQPEKTTSHGGHFRSLSAEQGKVNKRKSLAAYPPTPHTARSE